MPDTVGLATKFRATQDVHTTDAPFLLPADIVLDLPFPPSVNRLWKPAKRGAKARVFLAANYQRWKKAADMLVMANRQYPRRKIVGPFEAEIDLDDGAGRGDVDNRAKAVLDWAQRAEIIADDKHCRRLVIAWATHAQAPHGCRLTLRPLA